MDANFEKLLHKLTDALSARNLTIATAESCTGGLIAGFLTELPGSSAWFERGFVTYSNLSKEEMLGVDAHLIKQHGAVSDEVAQAMALGVLQHSAADMALSVTGIAGPDGGSLNKPVGTVYFAYARRGKTVQSEHCVFADSPRSQIRLQACHQALQSMLSFLIMKWI